MNEIQDRHYMSISELGSDPLFDAKQICLALFDSSKLFGDIFMQFVGVGDCAPLVEIACLPPVWQRANQSLSICKPNKGLCIAVLMCQINALEQCMMFSGLVVQM